MQTVFIQYIFLILIILALVMLANKMKIAYPIILVLGGLLLSFTSFFSDITIDPDAVFFIFLPPLLYEAAWQTSWKEFWKWRRVIMSFAFPIVIITSCVVAFFSTAIIPGFTLALGFLLGGIVSPPDAISATTIMRNVKVPKSHLSIVEGESLLNDASSLIVFRFALAAIVTGQFSFGEASTTFLLVVVCGIAIGLLVGLVFYVIHRLLPTTPSIEIILTFIAPYCMYYAAEHFHFSGVLSVVSGGLFLSSKRQSMLNYRSRIEGVNVWTNIVFVLNGLIFLLIGLQLPTITAQLGDISMGTAIGYGLAISAVLIISRFLCTFGASLFTRFMSHFITVADPNPGFKGPIILGWAGMRGVVSMATALAFPLTLADNTTPFPNRNLIIYLSFCVIVSTLVLLGVTLPWVIRKLKLPKHSIAAEEYDVRTTVVNHTISHIEENLSLVKDELLNNIKSKYEVKYSRLQKTDLPAGYFGKDAVVKANIFNEFSQLQIDLINVERKILQELHLNGNASEEILRKIERELDLEETRLQMEMYIG